VAIFVTSNVASGAQTAGAFDLTALTNQSAHIFITTAPTEVDSVYVCYADTTFAALGDSATTSYVITGLSPGVAYDFFLVTRDEGDTKVSASQEVTIYGPEIEVNPTTLNMVDKQPLIQALSWRPATILDSLVVDGASGADSSMVFIPYKTNSVVLNVTSAGDSVNVMGYLWYGERTMTQKGATVGYQVSPDSLNITKAGKFGWTFTRDVGAPAAYLKFEAYGDNGQNTTIDATLNRDRY